MELAAKPSVRAGTVDDVVQALLGSGAIAESSLERARRAARDSGERLDIVLRKLGLVSDERMTAVWAMLTSLPVASAADFPLSPVLPEQLRPEYLRQAGVLPLGVSDKTLSIALSDPLDQFAPVAIAALPANQSDLASS